MLNLELVPPALSSLFAANEMGSLGFIIATLISTLLCKTLKREITLFHKKTHIKNIIDKSKTLLYSFVFLTVFASVQLGLMIFHLNYTLVYIANAVIGAVFASNLLYLLGNKKISNWFISLIIIPITLCHLFGIWDKVEQHLSSINFSVGTYDIPTYKALKSLLIIFLMFWALRSILSFFDAQLAKSPRFKRNESMIFIQFVKITSYLGVFILSLQLIGIDLTVFAIFGGAVGVGIGLGLQKITANFISGFILLFEKTIKVNDLIELGDGLLGYVRFTGARHTLVETFNGKEIVIPNEDFIIHKVTNWTHSHNKARIDVKVGVSYNSDLRLVKELILSAARECSRVAKHPEPSCYLEAFGDSSVEFLLYFWVDDVTEGRKTPKSDVQFAIWEKFKEHNIVIPFPQRDLHLIQPQAHKTPPSQKTMLTDEYLESI